MNIVKERWVSGLNHKFAKLAKEVIPSEGSNPSLSAIKKTYIFDIKIVKNNNAHRIYTSNNNSLFKR